MKSSATGNLAFNILVSGSLTMIWSMIEGLQIVNHLPLFSVKSPGNVNFFNKFVMELTGFNFVDTEDLTEYLLYFPEMDAMSVNFQNAGYLNLFVIPNLGSLFYILVAHFMLASVVFCLHCGSKRYP